MPAVLESEDLFNVVSDVFDDELLFFPAFAFETTLPVFFPVELEPDFYCVLLVMEIY